MSHEKLGCSIKGEGPYLKRKLFSVNTFVGVHSCGSSISSGISFIEVLIKRDHLPDLLDLLHDQTRAVRIRELLHQVVQVTDTDNMAVEVGGAISLDSLKFSTEIFELVLIHDD